MRVKPYFSAHWLVAAGVALGLSACADMSGITAQAQLRTAKALGLESGLKTGHATAVSNTWWQDFGDAQLNRLIEQGLANNPQLQLVRTRLARAQAVFEVADAALLPQVNAGLDITRQRYTQNGLVPAPVAGSVRDNGTLQLSAGWELDFFGKHSAALQAAIGSVNAARADAEAARVLLASQIARSYVQWARLHDQLNVAQRTLAQREALHRLVYDRFTAGLDTQLELHQSEGGLPEARQQLEALQEQMAVTRHAMAALVGEPVLDAAVKAPSLAQLHSAGVASSLPADLLGRRADIVAARWRVEASSQNVAVAKTQFYPNINLSAYFGFASMGLGRLTDAGSQQWGVGPAVRLPIFDAGRLRAQLRTQTADLDAAIESYNHTVINAMRDVADQAAISQSIARQQVQQRQTQTAAESAYEIAVLRYQAGMGNYLQVLTTETNVLLQRRQAVDLQARALDAQVALIHALGGGYTASAAASNNATAPI